MVETLNLKQVAQRLDVHYMTAYRYVRQGRLRGERDGTGWVIQAEDVERFAAAGARSAATEQRTVSRTVDWTGRLVDRLVAGDETGAWSVVERALAAGMSPQSCYLEMVAGALARIGDGDESVGLRVADQYVATATAQRVVARLGGRFRRPGRHRGTLVLGAPRGEMHSLPIAIAADLVRLGGFSVLELGVDVPPEAFVAAATRADRLVAVGVGVTRVETLDAAISVVAALRAALPETPVLIGGQAVRNPEVAAITGATAWAGDGADLVTTLVALIPRQRGAVRHAAD